jgi:hypothetical protein
MLDQELLATDFKLQAPDSRLRPQAPAGQNRSESTTANAVS